jgi:hypothetical protein
MMATGQTHERQNPQAVTAGRGRQDDLGAVRGSHHGQRAGVPHKQAGHMTAPDRDRPDMHNLLATQGPSTHDKVGHRPRWGVPGMALILEVEVLYGP